MVCLFLGLASDKHHGPQRWMIQSTPMQICDVWYREGLAEGAVAVHAAEIIHVASCKHLPNLSVTASTRVS